MMARTPFVKACGDVFRRDIAGCQLGIHHNAVSHLTVSLPSPVSTWMPQWLLTDRFIAHGHTESETDKQQEQEQNQDNNIEHNNGIGNVQVNNHNGNGNINNNDKNSHTNKNQKNIPEGFHKSRIAITIKSDDKAQDRLNRQVGSPSGQGQGRSDGYGLALGADTNGAKRRSKDEGHKDNGNIGEYKSVQHQRNVDVDVDVGVRQGHDSGDKNDNVEDNDNDKALLNASNISGESLDANATRNIGSHVSSGVKIAVLTTVLNINQGTLISS
jgi:hypothetical protein